MMRMTAIKHANNALLQVPDSDLFNFWMRKEHVVNVILLSKIVLLIINFYYYYGTHFIMFVYFFSIPTFSFSIFLSMV